MMDSVIDMSVVDELLDLCDDGDPELLVDLIQMFLDDAPARLEAIQTGVATGDLEQVERAAHSLKGSAGNLGCIHVQNLAEDLQNAGRSGDASTATELAGSIQTRYVDAESELRALLQKFTVS